MQQHNHTTEFTDLPTEVWAHALQMLDVRDLARLQCAGGSGIIPADNALFVWRAGRVLSESELAWFNGSRVRVALLEEVRLTTTGVLFNKYTEHLRNGKLHRDNDLPALITHSQRRGDTLAWYQDGELHRENDQPALIMPRYAQEYFWRGKLHRPSGGPAIEYDDGRRFWYWNGVIVGGSSTPDEEPLWYNTASYGRLKKRAPKWAKWGRAAAAAAADRC